MKENAFQGKVNFLMSIIWEIPLDPQMLRNLNHVGKRCTPGNTRSVPGWVNRQYLAQRPNISPFPVDFGPISELKSSFSTHKSTRLEYDFLLLFLSCLLPILRPYSAMFLFFVFLRSCSSHLHVGKHLCTSCVVCILPYLIIPFVYLFYTRYFSILLIFLAFLVGVLCARIRYVL